MKSVTVITVTQDDLIALAKAKELLPDDVVPTISVTSTAGWMGTNQAEIVQLQFVINEETTTPRSRSK